MQLPQHRADVPRASVMRRADADHSAQILCSDALM